MDNINGVLDLCVKALQAIPDKVKAADIGSVPRIFGPDKSDYVFLSSVYITQFFRCVEPTMDYKTNERGQVEGDWLIMEPLAADPAMQATLFDQVRKYKRPTPEAIRKYAAMPADKFAALLVDIITGKGKGALDADSILWRCIYAGVIYLCVEDRINNLTAAFMSVPMNKGTSALALINKGQLDLDSLTKRATITVGDVIFEINNGYKGEISTEALRLSDFFAERYYQTHNPTLEIPLRDYAELKGRSTSKQALQKLKEEVISQMAELKPIGYRCKEKVNGKWKETGHIDINGGTAAVIRGTIRWNFNTDLCQQLSSNAPVDYPREAWRVDARTNQYFFIRYLAQNWRLNEGKPSCKKVYIHTLLQKTPNLPAYEEVLKGSGHVSDRIIKPVFRDLDALQSIYYEVYTSDGQRVDYPEDMDYQTFINAYIEVDYQDFPQHTERIKHRQIRQKKRAAAKEKREAERAAAAAKDQK